MSEMETAAVVAAPAPPPAPEPSAPAEPSYVSAEPAPGEMQAAPPEQVQGEFVNTMV